jgi:hypothetical protein
MSPSIIGKNYVFVSSFIINVVRASELCLYGGLRFTGFAKQQSLDSLFLFFGLNSQLLVLLSSPILFMPCRL